MRICLENPSDRLITERVQIFSGWFALDSKTREFELRATVCDYDVLLREFLHPASRLDPALCGFYGFIFLQDLLQFENHGWLTFGFHWGEQHVGELSLRVSPMAMEIASQSPLNKKIYRVRNRKRNTTRGGETFTLVFPGLGCVGGSSLNLLMRFKMYREGWKFPVYGEADDPELWKALCQGKRQSVAWIDGHSCYEAGNATGCPSIRMTMLRDPVRRIISVYNYNSLVHPREFPFATFEEFISSNQVNRYTQVLMLLHYAGRTPAPDATPEELFLEASVELDRNYSFVGITEFFEESIFLICDLQGYERIGMWWRVLSAPAFVRLERLSVDVLARLKEIVSADRQLYEERVKSLLESFGKCDFGDVFSDYKADAYRQSEISEIAKFAECLRWRTVLVEDELKSLRGHLTG